MRKFAVGEDGVAGVGTFPQPSAGLQRVLASVHLMGIEPGSAAATNHHLGSNSSLSLTPFFFSMHINHLRDLPAVR